MTWWQWWGPMLITLASRRVAHSLPPLRPCPFPPPARLLILSGWCVTLMMPWVARPRPLRFRLCGGEARSWPH